jgi:hypothetical protein
MNAPICESCGMPMESPEMFGGGRTDNRYCVYCTDEKGDLKPFDLKLEEMTRFTMTRMGMDETRARQVSREQMLKQPAWAHLA